jgi:hypothetical protein
LAFIPKNIKNKVKIKALERGLLLCPKYEKNKLIRIDTERYGLIRNDTKNAYIM